MTITFRKAGEAAAKAAVRAAGGTSAPAAAAGTATSKIPLRPPRAVEQAEAHKIEPAAAAATSSMMPWRGWFQRWLREQIGEEKFQKFRSAVFFMPDDIYDLQPPMPEEKIPISKTDPTITARYRYPAPGSQKPARIPEFESDEDPYDTGYFKKDTRRRFLNDELGDSSIEKAKLLLMDPENNPEVKEELERLESGPESSPGNQGRFATGPTDFDPSGLRATMSVTWTELEKSLDEHMPDHLPTPVWVDHEREIVAWHQERDLPVPVGGYYQALKVPVERRVARW